MTLEEKYKDHIKFIENKYRDIADVIDSIGLTASQCAHNAKKSNLPSWVITEFIGIYVKAKNAILKSRGAKYRFAQSESGIVKVENESV